MNGVSIAAGALAVFAIYRYSKSDSRGGSKDKDKGISKGRPSKVPIPPGCLPSPTGGPPVCPPREPTQNPPPSFNPFQPLQPPPPSPSDPFRPLQPPPPSPSDPSQPPPNPSNPDDGWRLNTSGYPQQAGCFIRRRYDANAADPWLPGTNGIIGRGWTPEMAPFATEPAACLLNETALKVARKYNNAGLSDEDLLVFSSGTNSSCLQWQSNPDKSDAGSITTIACQPFVPMGPAGHEYPQPQPPPPPSNASGFDYFLQQMIGSISQFSVLDPNDPYHPVYKSLGSQPVSGRSQLEQALKTCGLNPQCDFVELDGSADLWNCPGGWTPFGDGSACKKNTPSGQLQCTLWGNPTMDSCYPSGKPATKATLWGRTDPHYTLEQPKPASSPTWTFVKKGLGVEPPATVPPADTVVSGFFRWLNYDLPGETYAKAKAADEIACSQTCASDAACAWAVFDKDNNCSKRRIPQHKNQTTNVRTVDSQGHPAFGPDYPGGLNGWDIGRVAATDQASCSAACFNTYNETTFPGQPQKWAQFATFDAGNKHCYCKHGTPNQLGSMTLIKQVN